MNIIRRNARVLVLLLMAALTGATGPGREPDSGGCIAAEETTMNSGDYTEAVNGLTTEINKKGESRYEVNVRGMQIAPVLVQITGERGDILFEDYVVRPRNFSRIYDLGNLKDKKAEIRIHSDENLLASLKIE
jgi:hypothetical protein